MPSDDTEPMTDPQPEQGNEWGMRLRSEEMKQLLGLRELTRKCHPRYARAPRPSLPKWKFNGLSSTAIGLRECTHGHCLH